MSPVSPERVGGMTLLPHLYARNQESDVSENYQHDKKERSCIPTQWDCPKNSAQVLSNSKNNNVDDNGKPLPGSLEITIPDPDGGCYDTLSANITDPIVIKTYLSGGWCATPQAFRDNYPYPIIGCNTFMLPIGIICVFVGCSLAIYTGVSCCSGLFAVGNYRQQHLAVCATETRTQGARSATGGRGNARRQRGYGTMGNSSSSRRLGHAGRPDPFGPGLGIDGARAPPAADLSFYEQAGYIGDLPPPRYEHAISHPGPPRYEEVFAQSGRFSSRNTMTVTTTNTTTVTEAGPAGAGHGAIDVAVEMPTVPPRVRFVGQGACRGCGRGSGDSSPESGSGSCADDVTQRSLSPSFDEAMATSARCTDSDNVGGNGAGEECSAAEGCNGGAGCTGGDSGN